MNATNKNITIAILPFRVNGLDQKTSLFFEGFTEDLISNFSKFVGLSVISSYSTMQIRNTGDQSAVGKLGADYLIYGSVRARPQFLRISIELVTAADQQLVHASQYDETLDTLLETQDEIVQQIVIVLQEKIDFNLLSHSYKKTTVDLAAYENYLLGMHILRQGTAESDVRAREYFNAALEINPHFSLAYTGLSLSYFNFWSCLLWNRWDISQKGAHEFALKAIEIDPNDYVALGVLGRTFVYLEEYDQAEHYLRKSLRMNPSDTSNLLRVAFSLLFLGYAKESLKLYQRSLRLNPFHNDSYYAHGAIYFLETGNFHTSIELSKKVKFDIWADFPAFMAAAYLQIHDFDNMWECWNKYLQQFEKSIYVQGTVLEEEALLWLKVINPFRGFSYLHPLIDYIKSKKQISNNSGASPSNIQSPAIFHLEGAIWHIRYQDKTVLLKDAKGYHVIKNLLQEPTKEIHCLTLMNAQIDAKSATELIDEQARLAYKKRIQELREEMEEAHLLHLSEKAEQLQQEYDQLVLHLSQSLGLSGQARKVGSTVEKARSAVTWRIRSAIKKIQAQHPTLANHLNNSIRTGTFCSYTPEHQVVWEL